MKKILVTGASGFIGSFLVEEALEKQWETWAGIRQSSSKEYLQDKNIRFIDLNFANEEILKQQIEDHVAEHGRWNYIIHNAGVTKCLNKADFDKVNHQYTRHFINALRDTGNIPDKFIFMSSLSVFGAGDEINYTPLRLSDQPRPNTAYGLSKLKAEQYIKSLTDFPYMILRPTGVYGPREKDYFLMIKSIRAGFDFGAGYKPQHLTFIYVKDLVKAVFLALESPLKNREYFVADGDAYTDKAYTQIVKRSLCKKHVIRIKVPLFLLKVISIISELIGKITNTASTLNRDKYKIMKQRNWECETAPIEKDLGFEAEFYLTKGMQECIKWYKANKWL